MNTHRDTTVDPATVQRVQEAPASVFDSVLEHGVEGKVRRRAGNEGRVNVIIGRR